jgi:hypothetical protein
MLPLNKLPRMHTYTSVSPPQPVNPQTEKRASPFAEHNEFFSSYGILTPPPSFPSDKQPTAGSFYDAPFQLESGYPAQVYQSKINQKAPTPEEYSLDIVANPFPSAKDFYAPSVNTSPPEFFHPRPMMYDYGIQPFQTDAAFNSEGEDAFISSDYQSTPLFTSYEPRPQSAMQMQMPTRMNQGFPASNGEYVVWRHNDPVDARSTSVPNLMPSVTTLLRSDWKEPKAEDDGEHGGYMPVGKGKKRSWPCIFQDCRKVYTTGAGMS